MIALDLCQAHYQILLIIYLKFTAKVADIIRKKTELVFNFMSLKNNKLHQKYKICQKRWLAPVSGLPKMFWNTYKFCNDDINKFNLLLRKGIYPYKYMDIWERFDKRALPNKEAFYSNLNIDITDVDYRHADK